MSPRASLPSRIFPSHASNAVAAIIRPADARTAAAEPDATALAHALCTTLATRVPAARSISSSLTPSITVASATVTSPSISPTWPGPSAITPAVSRSWLSASWPRMVWPTKPPPGASGVTIVSSSPWPPSRTGSRRPGEKKVDSISTTYLDKALADFSGYLAIDEMYDGPFCVLSVVDNRRYNRLAFRVLEHDPSQEDIRAFLSEFKEQLDKRGLRVRGITTDGSSLYPEVLKELWPKAPHQVCVFHVLQEILKAVLRVLAKLRKERKAQIPKQRRGRPRQQDKARVRRIQRLPQRVAELFTHGHLFVRRHRRGAEEVAEEVGAWPATVTCLAQHHGRGVSAV